jgi:DNA-binding GntR family transcriptional regulator
MSEGPASSHEALKLREQAYVGYTRSLLANEIKPGQFITQRELVAITGLPLGAIRELVPRLEAEGLIRTAPHRGMQVPQVDITSCATPSSSAFSSKKLPCAFSRSRRRPS